MYYIYYADRKNMPYQYVFAAAVVVGVITVAWNWFNNRSMHYTAAHGPHRHHHRRRSSDDLISFGSDGRFSHSAPQSSSRDTDNSAVQFAVSGFVSDVCVVCLNEEVGARILPCKHICLCLCCADMAYWDNKPCPMCRSHIANIQSL